MVDTVCPVVAVFAHFNQFITITTLEGDRTVVRMQLERSVCVPNSHHFGERPFRIGKGSASKPCLGSSKGGRFCVVLQILAVLVEIDVDVLLALHETVRACGLRQPPGSHENLFNDALLAPPTPSFPLLHHERGGDAVASNPLQGASAF